MSPTSPSNQEKAGSSDQSSDPNPPTIASFSPPTLSHVSSVSKQRSTILVHQKSPLLIATPPQITRALAYSHPFLLPLNRVIGLITWTSGDPWESFLLLAAFWGVTLYGDAIMRYAGPVVVVAGLILGMYSRRYSPLSSTGWTGEKQKKGHKREDSEVTNMAHQKTLDEIVETLKVFTSRCNVLLDPLLHLTDFLSTQRTATSATVRPALTTLFIRILLLTPFWIVLSLSPIQVITTRRISLLTGTIFLSWHSRPAQVSRVILWRSILIRKMCSALTGLSFPITPTAKGNKHALQPSKGISGAGYQEGAHLAATAAAKRKPDAASVRFTFILFENQRRWVGLGWTTSLFGYERAAWTDDHSNAAPPREEFELPEVEGGHARWRWADGGRWLVEGAAESDEGGKNAKADATDGGQGWVYYDNKWQNGRRGIDGWGKYTRRRKWYRDAELVEITPSTEVTPTASTTLLNTTSTQIDGVAELSADPPPQYSPNSDEDSVSVASMRTGTSGRSSGLRRGGTLRRETGTSRRSDEEIAGARRESRGGEWGIGDDARMGLE